MIYWFDPRLNWKTFRHLNDKFSRDEGPVPQNIDKILWKMLKNRQINLYLDTRKVADPICLTLKDIPKKSKILTNLI